MQKYDTVIFDFDGTVADTGDGVFSSVRYALDKLGLSQPSEEEIRTFLGPPLDFSFRNVCKLDDETIEEAIRLYRTFYPEKGVYMFTLYDGMTELFKSLSDKGIKIAIASAKPEVFLKTAVSHAGIERFVGFVGGTTLENKDTSKASVIKRAMEAVGAEPDKTLMVGDRCFDINSAKEVGIKSIGVLFGYGTKEELSQSCADYLVNSPDEILKIIDTF